MEVAGATDAEERDAAAAALQSFWPGLIINRVSDSSQVNVLYLRKILHQYVGGDLTLLGEVPDDPAVSQAVRKFLPVIEAAPESSAAKGLLAVSAAVEQLVSASVGRSIEETKQSEGKETRVLLSHPVSSQDPQASLPLKSEDPSPLIESRHPGCTSTIRN
jgi:flagellar biosynthesis protein FlhG